MVLTCMECGFFIGKRCHAPARSRRGLSVPVRPDAPACPSWRPIRREEPGRCVTCAHWSRGWCVERRVRRSEWDWTCALWRPASHAPHPAASSQ